MTDKARIMERLAPLVGQEHLKTDSTACARFAVDGVVPWAVVFPANTPELAEVVRAASSEHMAMVPWGAGSRMGAGKPPERVDLVICLDRMNRMLDVDVANLTITVEAGVRFRDIQARLATEEDRCYLPLGDGASGTGEPICSERSHSGCFLPIDPALCHRATIGGIIASNASGPRRLLYGLPRDLLLGVRLVTPWGEVIGAGGKTVKNVSGYDVSKLMIGSYGTLGILVEMTLRLLPLPERMQTLALGFEDFPAAHAFASRVFQTKLLPAALEVCNARAWNWIGPRPLGGRYVALVALEAFSEAVERMRREMLLMADLFGLREHAVLEEDAHRALWSDVSRMSAVAAEGGREVLELQLYYPISAWGNLFETAQKLLEPLGPETALLYHAGSGVMCVIAGLEYASRAHVPAAVRQLLAACRREGGNLMVCQAPVDLKPNLPIWGEPGPDLSLMARVRAELDPERLMNPGRFLVEGPVAGGQPKTTSGAETLSQSHIKRGQQR